MAQTRTAVEEKLQQAHQLVAELDDHDKCFREAGEQRGRVAEGTVRRLGYHARKALHGLVERWPL